VKGRKSSWEQVVSEQCFPIEGSSMVVVVVVYGERWVGWSSWAKTSGLLPRVESLMGEKERGEGEVRM
jgi:hypothetical protein